jgi:TonB-linked SusC/RagA family outer membrane protein
MVVVSKREIPTVDKVKGTNSIPVIITGKVTDTTGSSLLGATIKIRGSEKIALTNSEGIFSISAEVGDEIEVSFIGYESYSFKVKRDQQALNIALHRVSSKLKEVSVVFNGYQTLPKERATGSFTQIDNNLLNRSVSTNILDRLNGVTSGLIFTDNGNHQFGQANIEVRGRATLFSNPDPLIIMDNFPYDGNVSNINPNDIESITILKDAAAASVWGARSGNGVVVITTKKGHLNSAPTVSFNANTTVGAKPDLYYTPQLTSSQYIGIEQFLFNQGAYDSAISDGFSALSPAVEIFSAKRNGSISAVDSLAAINKLKGYDSRQQILKYYYRQSVNQQYQASISGGGDSQKYFVSAGYDKNLNSYVNSDYDRVTLNASNTYYLLNNKLEFFSNIIFTGSTTKSGPVINSTAYPYDQLANANGNPLAVANTLRLSYATTAGNGQLLNWLYKPLEELNNGYSNNISKLTDYRINLSLTYKIFKGFKAMALYNYEKSINESDNLNELQSYYTRNLINTFTEIDPTTGAVSYPISMGGILYTNSTNSSSNNGRFQLNYDNSWGKHAVSIIAGSEIKDYSTFNSTNGLYGYNPETATNQNVAVNYTAYYPYFYGYNSGQIPTNTTELGTDNRFFSYYANGSYTYDDKYIASISARRDESNLFGVTTNQKGIPLWSTGLAWIINKEDFYKVDWLPQLKLRATYGYTGNVNNNLSAYLTAAPGLQSQPYNSPYTQIVNPPNPSLRWERDQNINIGLDFASKSNRVSGSIDLWRKNGMDLIGNSPIAPQTGITLYTGNSANTSTKGIDLQINTINLAGKLKWQTTLLYNYVHSLVTIYKVSNGTNYNVVSANYNNPLQGYPYYAIFSFKYAGLNNTGDPQGYLNGAISTEYTSIMNSLNRSQLVYNGSATPTSFGSLRNTFTYKAIDLSFNITYKFGYYFRRNSLSNDEIYSTGGGNYQMADFGNQWQKPGDELHTNVPALIYPSDSYRTALYTYSNVLVENGANVRFQDLRLGYTFNKGLHLPIRNLNVFTYINNIGILWRANKYHIDPDYPTGIPVPRTIAFGIKGDL